MAVRLFLDNPRLLAFAARTLVWVAIMLAPRIVDVSDSFSVWRFKRRRALRRKAAELRKQSRSS